MSSVALTSSGITTQALSGTVAFCLHPTCQNSNDYASPGSYGYRYLLGRRFAPILVALGCFIFVVIFSLVVSCHLCFFYWVSSCGALFFCFIVHNAASV